MIRKLKFGWAWMVAVILQGIPHAAYAAGGGLDTPDQLDRKVPLEGLSGIYRFFAKTYNDNLWAYAIYCTVLMAVVGIAIAFVTDIILKGMGMEVEKIEHKE